MTDSDGKPLPPAERGAAMSYAERLRWLELAKREFGALLGRAVKGKASALASDRTD